MSIRISQGVLAKIRERMITPAEISQCFMNREGGLCVDTRAHHLTDPLTNWFVAKTDQNRLLKIMFVPVEGGVELKSAYDATAEICRIYNKYAKP